MRRAKGKGRSSKLTWTLVALRAATEPAKEEAMQAIVLDVFGVCESFGCVLENEEVVGELAPFMPFQKSAKSRSKK